MLLTCVGALVGVGLAYFSRPHTVDAALNQANKAINAGLTENYERPGPPGIVINGPRIHIDWMTSEYGGMPNMVYSVLVLNANNTYEDVWCNNEAALEDT